MRITALKYGVGSSQMQYVFTPSAGTLQTGNVYMTTH